MQTYALKSVSGALLFSLIAGLGNPLILSAKADEAIEPSTMIEVSDNEMASNDRGPLTFDLDGKGTKTFDVSLDTTADKHRLQWNPAWPRFRVAEYAATGAMAAGIITANLTINTPSSPHWTGGILFDESVRNGLRATTQSGRDAANTASNIILYALIAMPVIDTGAVVLAGDKNPGVAWQLFMLDAETMAVTATLMLTTKDLIGRERPYARECAANPNAVGCDAADRNASFISGHTAMSFASAGLVCAEHRKLPIYGGGWPDKIACITAMAAATTDGALRIVADKHYATDVLAGAAVGLFSGYFLPNLLHFGNTSITPVATPDYVGFSMTGGF